MRSAATLFIVSSTSSSSSTAGALLLASVGVASALMDERDLSFCKNGLAERGLWGDIGSSTLVSEETTAPAGSAGSFCELGGFAPPVATAGGEIGGVHLRAGDFGFGMAS